jgi:hypothetical protein
MSCARISSGDGSLNVGSTLPDGTGVTAAGSSAMAIATGLRWMSEVRRFEQAKTTTMHAQDSRELIRARVYTTPNTRGFGRRDRERKKNTLFTLQASFKICTVIE